MAFSGLAGNLRNAALDLGGNRLMRDWLAEVWAADPDSAVRTPYAHNPGRADLTLINQRTTPANNRVR